MIFCLYVNTGQSNNHESNHPRSSDSGGWRTNSTSDRDANTRRPLPKRESMLLAEFQNRFE